MISTSLQVLKKGLLVMRSNTKLLLVGVLVFVFPLIFVWVTQSFFSTAYDNINTSEKQRVTMLHDSLAVLVKEYPSSESILRSLLDAYKKENSDITKIKLVKQTVNGFQVLLASDPELEGTYEVSDQLFRTLPLAGTEGSFVYKTVLDGVRTWQVFRSVSAGDSELFIFSEHSFKLIDAVMLARRQQSYYGLSAIFIFLISLAYWLNRQTYWQKRHEVLRLQLEERDLFSNMIAHEFRTPLTVIKGYASFLQESKNLTLDEVQFARNIRTSSERLVVLVNDFLEVARIQSGKLKVKKEEVDLRNILQAVVADLSSLAQEKGLQLSVAHNPASEPILLLTDSDRMIQALTNIVSNSIKYTDVGSVEVEVVKKRGKITVRIKDTGTGISASDQQKLFAPFARVGGVDKGAVVGTGLGMWITKQIITLLGGLVEVESIKGVGTHVVISFSTHD